MQSEKQEVIQSEKHGEVQNTNNKTQRVKKNYSDFDKSRLWNIFDTDITEEGINDETQAECVYDSETQNRCQSCKSELMIMDHDFPTCINPTCRIVYKEVLDFSPEWSYYGNDDRNGKDPARCGNPINPLLVESSFACKVMTNNKSSFEMRKIRKWTEWQAMPHREKALYDEFQFITIMARNSGIPKIFIDCAMTIHKDISEQKMFRGLNRDGIKAASLYISCRLNGCPRNAHEIADIFKLDNAAATNGCSMAVTILNNIERNLMPCEQTTLQTITPMSFLDRFCSKLSFTRENIMLCKFIAKKIEVLDITSSNIPHAIAAGIIFFVSQITSMNVRKKDIKTICGVSEVTINKCAKKLDEHKSQLVPQQILDKYYKE